VLVFIAVPLKYWAGIPSVVSILGPIHGLAFLVYIWMVINTAASGSWNAVEIVRLIVCSFVPLGGYFNEPFIRRRQQKIAGLN
jgi:integral membrane protein